MIHSFTVTGRPVPLPRMTRRDQYLSPPRPCVGRYRRYADDVRQACTGFPMKRCEERPFKVRCEFVFADPRDKKKIDLDNLCKGVLDALFKDDSFIDHLELIKRVAAGDSEHTFITLETKDT